MPLRIQLPTLDTTNLLHNTLLVYMIIYYIGFDHYFLGSNCLNPWDLKAYNLALTSWNPWNPPAIGQKTKYR